MSARAGQKPPPSRAASKLSEIIEIMILAWGGGLRFDAVVGECECETFHARYGSFAGGWKVPNLSFRYIAFSW